MIETLAKVISPEMGLVAGAVSIAFFGIALAWAWRAWEDKRHDRLVSLIVNTISNERAKDRAKLELTEKKVDEQHRELVKVWSDLDACRRECDSQIAVLKDRMDRL